MNNLIIPFYKTNIMYDETLVLVAETDKEGNIISLPKGDLLFKPDEIIEVKQYLSKDNNVKYFKLNKDFVLNDKTITIIGDIKNDKIVSTGMPYITDKELNGERIFPGFSFMNKMIPSTTKGLFIPYTESSEIVKMQLSITYKHSDKWNYDTIVSKKDILKNITTKIENKENINILVFGDSISTGSNSSKILNVYPYLEPWYELVKTGIEEKKNIKVNMINKSVGGWTSKEGVSSKEEIGWVGGIQISQVGLPVLLDTELKDYKPDLFIVGFGMNDATLNIGLDNYEKNIKKMIDGVLKLNPKCDCIILGTMLANPSALEQSKNQTEYSKLNDIIVSNYKNIANVVSLDMGIMHKNLLKFKKYIDMTGNNVNHPNDFMARVYAMNILETIIGD